jgi:hypothetical protein
MDSTTAAGMTGPATRLASAQEWTTHRAWRDRCSGPTGHRRGIVHTDSQWNGYPEVFRWSMSGRLPWKPDGVFSAGWKADTPLMADDRSRARLIVPARAAPVPLRVGGGAVCGSTYGGCDVAVLGCSGLGRSGRELSNLRCRLCFRALRSYAYRSGGHQRRPGH